MGWNGATLFRHLVTPANVNFEYLPAEARARTQQNRLNLFFPAVQGYSRLLGHGKVLALLAVKVKPFCRFFILPVKIKSLRVKALCG
ncbi:MAG: hypothetical protein RRY29_07375 [Desulfovibrionaceae bacterium]